MRTPIWIAVLIVILAGLACTSTGPSCGGETGPPCVQLTISAVRLETWNEYCASQPDCTAATGEGLQVQLGPDSASAYGGYDPTLLTCSEAIFTLEDGSSVTRKFIVLGALRAEEFEIIEEVDVASCIDLQY